MYTAWMEILLTLFLRISLGHHILYINIYIYIHYPLRLVIPDRRNRRWCSISSLLPLVNLVANYRSWLIHHTHSSKDLLTAQLLSSYLNHLSRNWNCYTPQSHCMIQLKSNKQIIPKASYSRINQKGRERSSFNPSRWIPKIIKTRSFLSRTKAIRDYATIRIYLIFGCN